MRKILLTPTLIILITLAACSGTAPTATLVTESTPDIVAATPPPPANIADPTATMEPTPTTPSTPRATSPPPIQGQEALLASLSEAELTCIGRDPQRMLTALSGGAPASTAEQARLTQCLDDDTVHLIFMTTIIPIPFSVETSACILAALDVIDPRAVMTARLEGDPHMAGMMAAFTVSVACLNDEEWAAAAPKLGMRPEDRDEMACIMAALGGPSEMATAMTEAMAAADLVEGTALYQAGLECGMEHGPKPTATPVPMPEPTATPSAELTPTPTTEPTPLSTKTPASTPAPAATAAPATSPTATATPPTMTPPTPTQPPAQPSALWRGITIAPENRCSQYDPDDYHYSPSVEPRIVDAQGGIYGPYTGTWFDSIKDTDIEHIVARSEAHDSGLCAADPDTKDEFASDLLNLTLASPSVNRHQKVDKDAAEWLPDLNVCWYVDRIVQVRLEYGLTIDRAEANAIEDILADCESTEMVVLAPTTSESATATPAPHHQIDALAMYDDNGNGRITCAEARAHGIAPVHREHPAYEYMRDADGDGLVCE